MTRTLSEQEREAYVTGNTDKAKLLRDLEDAEHAKELLEEEKYTLEERIEQLKRKYNSK